MLASLRLSWIQLINQCLPLTIRGLVNARWCSMSQHPRPRCGILQCMALDSPANHGQPLAVRGSYATTRSKSFCPCRS